MAVQVIEKLEKIRPCLSSSHEADAQKAIITNVWWLLQNLREDHQQNMIGHTILSDFVQTLTAVLECPWLELKEFERTQFTDFLERLKHHQQRWEAERLIRARYSLSDIRSFL